MEGARYKVPVLILVIFGTLFQENNAHQGHYHTREEVVVDEDVNRCTALVRKTSIEKQLVSYPCFRPLPGITPVVAHQSPEGLVCKGYTSVPATNYYRVKMCCPGWTHDQQGRCVIRGNRQLIVQKSIMPKKNLNHLTKYPASYEDRRDRVIQYLKPMFNQMLKQQQQNSWEEMVRQGPSWENMVRQRMQEAIRHRAIMRQRYIRHMQEQMFRQIQMVLNSRIIPLSVSASIMTRIPTMDRQLHIRRPQQTTRVPHPMMPHHPHHPHHPFQQRQMPAKPFPQIPNIPPTKRLPVNQRPPHMMTQGPVMQPRPFMMHRHAPPPQEFPRIPNVSPNPFFGRNFPGVQLPQLPVEMPPVMVRPGPNSPFGPPPCFANYMETIKRCYKESGAAPPSGRNLFNDVADEIRHVCQKRNIIINCIQENLGRCEHPQEQMMVRGSLETTIAELHGMCQSENIDAVDTADTQQQTGDTVSSLDDILSKTNEEIESRFTGENVVKETKPEVTAKPDPIPVETKVEKPKPKEKVKVNSDKDVKVKPQPVPVKEEPKKKAEKVEKQNDISAQRAHDIKVEELEQEVHHHYLPLLIGTAVAVGAIIILLVTLVCLCCRRKMKKMMYIEKEPEKPKLFDGIYTIGVPPPVYEVNGIPPLSYEEAKGLKITGTPTSARRNMDNEINDQQETASVNGTVSDI